MQVFKNMQKMDKSRQILLHYEEAV